jgi:hypothetical protein
MAVPFISSVLRADPVRWQLLGLVDGLNLPDCWIAAGFVRNAVWDRLHDRSSSAPIGDVDVIWYDAQCTDAAQDRDIEGSLRALEPAVDWSVKNQARMHMRNGDAPYPSAVEAMRYWPETATAVAARRSGPESCEIAAPLGLDDLLNLMLRPTSRFREEKRLIYEERIQLKAWLSTWPLLAKAEA